MRRRSKAKQVERSVTPGYRERLARNTGDTVRDAADSVASVVSGVAAGLVTLQVTRHAGPQAGVAAGAGAQLVTQTALAHVTKPMAEMVAERFDSGVQTSMVQQIKATMPALTHGVESVRTQLADATAACDRARQRLDAAIGPDQQSPHELLAEAMSELAVAVTTIAETAQRAQATVDPPVRWASTL